MDHRAIRGNGSAGAGCGQRGYALLMVLFLAAVAIITFAAAAPNLLTQGRREREDELIWRGEQYERGIRLYYRKLGRFPTSMEDLTKGNNGIHFLRKAYTDPMNTADGSWRLIYVLPSGQLVGSVRFISLAQMAAALHPGGVPPNVAAALGAAGPQQPGQPTTPPIAEQPTPTEKPEAPSGEAAQATPSPGAEGALPGAATNPCAAFPIGGQGAPGGNGMAGPQSASSFGGDQGAVFGGQIIGVASKVNRPSIKVYNCGKKYHDWEFIWNPAAQQAQAGVQPGQQPPANPAGNNPRLQFMNPNPPPPPPRQTPPL
jgi:type II secretory pathway pseudopilin PulG